jgi:DNA-binding response OmpR family regulator
MGSGPGSAPAGRPSRGPSSVSVGGVTLDVSQRRVVGETCGREVQISLTPLQAAVLAYMMRRPGQVCTRQDLMREALGYPHPIGSRTIDVHVATIRGKLGGVLEIRAVRGVGYALEGPVGKAE